MGRRSPASLAPSLGNCKYNISLMAAGQVPLVSTTLRKVARSAMADSGSSRNTAMLQRSTPLALPKGQWLMMDFKSPVLQEECEVSFCGKEVCPGCQSLLQASSSAWAAWSGDKAKQATIRKDG
eukprot:3962260-Amphidinium_carterae.2